jgi:hypothetical protein
VRYHTLDAQRTDFPGPDQVWPVRKVSEKIGLRLPYGEMTFTVGELEAYHNTFPVH